MSSPTPPSRSAVLRRPLLALAVFIPLAVGVHLGINYAVFRFGVFGPLEEVIESVLLVLIIGLPLFHLFVRYFRELQAAHQAQLLSAQGREAELRQANRSLRIRSRCSEVFFRARTEEELLAGVCRAVVEVGNYRMAWVGYAENDPAKTVRPVASWGDHTGYLKRMRVSWGPDEWGRGLVGRAIRGRAVVTAADTEEEAGLLPWREAAAEAGLASALCAPLLGEGGEAFGVLHVYSAQTDAFPAPDAETFRDLASDVVFGLRALRAERERWRQFEENRKLVQAVDQSASSVLIVNSKRLIEYANSKFTQTTGYTLEDVKGREPRMLASGDMTDAEYERGWETIASGREYRATFRDRKKDGSLYWAATTIAPVMDERGVITHFVAVQEDITPLKETQGQIERYAARLQKLLQLDRDISATLDLDEVFRLVVRAAAEFLDVAFALLYTTEDGKPRYRADHGGWSQLRGHVEILPGGGTDTVFRTGKPHYIEDASQLPVWKAQPWVAAHGVKSYLGVPLKRGEAVGGVLGVISRGVRTFSREDTELLALLANHAAIAIENARLHQEAEKGLEFLRTVLDTSPAAIQVLDAESRILYWNAAAEALFGYTAREIAEGKTGIIVPESEKARTEAAVAQIMRGERVGYETLRRRKYGDVFPARVIGAPVKDAGGRVVARTIVFEDLTGQKRAEREREEHIERLKTLNVLTAQISASSDLDEVFRYIVRSAADFLSLDFVVLFTADNMKLTYRVDHGGWRDIRGSGNIRPGSLTSKVLETGKLVYAEDLHQLPDWQPRSWVAEQGIKSFLGIPLKQGERVIGVLTTLCRGVRKFSDQEIEQFSLLANHAAIAIEKARLHQDVQRGLEFFRSVIASSADPILTLDAQNRILSWNEGAESVFGFRAEEAIGKTADETIVPEDDRAVRDAAVAEIMRGGKFTRETLRRRKDGALVPVRVTGSPVRDAEGRVVARTAIFQDLTAQKRAEREREAFTGRLKALNGLLAQISSSLKEEEVLRFAVQAAGEILGLPLAILFVADERGDLVARAHIGKWADTIGMRRLNKGQGLAGLVTARGEPVYIREVAEAPQFRRKQEARRLGVGSYLGAPLKVRGEVIGVLSCMTEGVREFTPQEVDLVSALASGAATAVANAQAHTRLQEAFEKLRHSQTMLMRAEKLSSIATLTAGAAHEILNPANIIGLHAQRLMWENEEGSGPHQSAKVIQRNVERISRICEDLRRFSREETARREPFSPDDALRQCLRPLDSELRLASIEVSYRLAKEAPSLLGDKGQIQQVFFNLLRNAMDAMAAGGGTLTVASREVREDGRRWWETRVSDTGAGIAPEVMPRIFDPFFTTKPEDKGTGLGLSVAYGIVESHGGRIWGESNPEKGATFIVWLPIKEEEGDEQAAPAHSDRG